MNSWYIPTKSIKTIENALSMLNIIFVTTTKLRDLNKKK